MDKKIYAFTAQEVAVIKTALGALAAVLEQPHPAKQMMEALMVMAAPDLPDPARHVDKLIDGEGLDIGEVVNILGAPADDPFVVAARESESYDDISFDTTPILATADGGAHVMGWVWISNAVAGAGS